jgi:hypothetical protein
LSNTSSHCLRLLDLVLEAGDDSEVAYQARNRLRRALVALERGPRWNGRVERPPVARSPALARRTQALAALVSHLCQPSEALDDRWRREWRIVRTEVLAIRELLASQA